MVYQQPVNQNQYNNSQSSITDINMNEDSYSTYGEQQPEFITMQIDVDPILEDFEHRVLRGEYRYVDSATGKKSWVPMSKIKIINETGIRELMSRIMGKVTIAGKLTYKTEEEIYKDMFYFHLSIVELAAKRCDIWDADIEVVKALVDAAIELVWDIASSSRAGFTAINLRSQYSRSDITRNDSQAKDGSQKSFLGIPLGGRK